jgi:hypothetical protein
MFTLGLILGLIVGAGVACFYGLVLVWGSR